MKNVWFDEFGCVINDAYNKFSQKLEHQRC